MMQIKAITQLTKWYSRHIKGSSKKIWKSKAIKIKAKVKNCKEYVILAELYSNLHSNIVNSVESILYCTAKVKTLNTSIRILIKTKYCSSNSSYVNVDINLHKIMFLLILYINEFDLLN